ncbi:DoxX family protein [Streptomyces tanashiensis]|uniref:DoxX family protein n=1 Tax=Streptomyces tanashiensis TaxID=67367 RepID=UPI0036DFDA4A
MTGVDLPQVVDNMAKPDVPEPWLPWLATAKTAGAIGLLVGLAVPAVGGVAAIGVILHFAGAVITHLPAKDYARAPAVALTLLPTAALLLRAAST